MKKINFQKDVLPHLIAIGVFLIITVFFFQPVVFDNQSLIQGDIQQWRGSAQELIQYRNETGQEGLWTNSIFGGMPAYFVNVVWGAEIIKKTHALLGLGLPHPVALFFITSLCFYIMLLCFKVRPMLAMIGAVCFAFCTYNIIGVTAGHNSRIVAMAYAPLVIGGIHLTFQRYRLLGSGLTALGLALHLMANHLQMTYYLVFVVGIYLVIQAIHDLRNGRKEQFIKNASLLALAALVATGTFAGKFYAAYDFGKYSNRGKSELSSQDNPDGLSKGYAFQYSNGINDPISLFIPNFLGGNAQLSMDSELAETMRRAGAPANQIAQYTRLIPTYWGSESPTTYYAGAIFVFLCVCSFFYLDRKMIIWLLSISLLGVLLSYGRNLPAFNYFMFDYFPGYSKFRSVTFTMILPVFGIILLGILTLEELLSRTLTKKDQKLLVKALAATGGTALILALFAGLFSFESQIDAQLPAELADAVQNDRKSIMRADTLRSFGFIAVFGALLLLNSMESMKKRWMVYALMLLPALDNVLVGKRFVSENNYQRQPISRSFSEQPGDKFIASNELPGDRVIDLSSPYYDAGRSYFHHMINGYNGIRVRRFQDLIDRALLAEHGLAQQMLQSGNRNFSDLRMLNMLNTRFLLGNPQSERGVIINPLAAGPAWFVGNVDLVNGADEEMQSTLNLNSVTQTAIIDESDFSVTSKNLSSSGNITLTDYHPGYWKYESNNPGAGLGVFSEVYYPKDFKVSIDGEEVDMLRANYVLRALEIPAGKHEIIFSYEPAFFKPSVVIMNISSLLLWLWLIGAVYLRLKPINLKSSQS